MTQAALAAVLVLGPGILAWPLPVVFATEFVACRVGEVAVHTWALATALAERAPVLVATQAVGFPEGVTYVLVDPANLPAWAVGARLGLAAGEPYRPSRLEAARRALLEGGALAWARLTPGDTPDGQGRLPLTLEVAERPRRVLRLAGAWSSDEGGTLSTSWTHRNLFGRAEQLTLRGEVGRLIENGPQALTYLANATLRIPDLWVRDLTLRLDLGAVSESLDAYDREAVTGGLALERRLSAQFSGSAGVAFERSRATQDGLAQDYWLLSLPLTLTYDTTDEPLHPRRGLRLAALVTPAQELDADGQGFVLGRLTGSAYWDLGGALRFQPHIALPLRQPEIDLIEDDVGTEAIGDAAELDECGRIAHSLMILHSHREPDSEAWAP